MNKFLKIIGSTKITVVCLFLLFILTFWGTVAQVEQGLYAAQERFFFSMFFLAGGFLPFPGAQLVLWVMFFNLIAASFTYFSKLKDVRYIGLKISHFGIFIYFIAAFVTFHVTEESNMRLLEGEGSNVASSYTEWELAYWSEAGNELSVTAYDIGGVKAGDVIQVGDLKVVVDKFYLNCEAFQSMAEKQAPLNSSGISVLEEKEIIKDREKNIAGGVFLIDNTKVLLFALDAAPTKVGDRYFSLRHKRYQMPFTLRLKEFKPIFHPGTQMAKSFESMVEVIKPGATRDVRIYMNNPLREKDYAFYQASYEVDQMGRKHSTIAVVKNSGQLLPYIACFVVFFGMTLHFIMAAFRRKKL